jgi:nitronate monooxygenase
LAAALFLGAEGVLIGTRFHATKESNVDEKIKQAIVDATGDNTLRTKL